MNFNELVKNQHSNIMGFARHYMLLYSIVYGLEAKSCFEFGVGFSSKVILRAMKDANGLIDHKLISCDVRPVSEFNELPMDNIHWKFYSGKSEYVLKTKLEDEVFDFVLHDGSHNGDAVYSDLIQILPRMKQNSIILVHDVCHPKFGRGISKAISRALKSVDKREKAILPYGSGLAVIRIKGNKKNGVVKPKWRKKK